MSSNSMESLEFCEESKNVMMSGTQDDDDDDEILFVDSEKDEGSNKSEQEKVSERQDVLPPAGSIPIVTLADCEQTANAVMGMERSISDMITDVVQNALTDLEYESGSSENGQNIAEKSRSLNRLKVTNSRRKMSSHPSTNKIYATSSFCKTAAGFLLNHSIIPEEEAETKKQRKRPADADNQEENIKLPGYEKFARSKSAPTNKAQKSPRASETRVYRTKSGSIDFIRKNKSMVSSPRNHSAPQTSKRRPKTAVVKKRSSVSREKRPSTVRQYSLVPPVNLRRDSSKNSKEDPSEEWSVLDERQLASFRKLFSRFDQTKSGGICPEELFSAIKKLVPDETIPFEDVRKVHEELDIKQTGEIEFDEFLFAMTNPKNYLKLIQDDDRKKVTNEIKLWEEFQHKKNGHKIGSERKTKQTQSEGKENGKDGNNIFFTMLKTATKKESMHEIRKFYVNKIEKSNDHVIHDWSAGQRCIGLSDQGVLRRYNHIMKELNKKKSSFSKGKQYQDSPYAQPLYWGLEELKMSELRRKSPRDVKAKHSPKKSVVDSEKKGTEQEPLRKDSSIRRASSAREPTKTTSTAKKNTPPQRVPYSSRPSLQLKHPLRKDVYRVYSAPPTADIKPTTLMGKRETKKRAGGSRSAPARRIKISEFVVTPKVVPLPIYPMRGSPPMDYDNVEEIRKRAAIILQEYYNKLKKVSATNSKEIYNKLQVDQISPILQRHFKKSYLAYSGEYEPFVVSPWIPYPTPSPWMQSAPLGYSCLASPAWT